MLTYQCALLYLTSLCEHTLICQVWGLLFGLNGLISSPCVLTTSSDQFPISTHLGPPTPIATKFSIRSIFISDAPSASLCINTRSSRSTPFLACNTARREFTSLIISSPGKYCFHSIELSHTTWSQDSSNKELSPPCHGTLCRVRDSFFESWMIIWLEGKKIFLNIFKYIYYYSSSTIQLPVTG